ALLLVALSFAWIYLARRARIAGDPGFVGAGVAAAFIGQAVAMVAANQPGSPSMPLLLTCHLVLVGALLWLSWHARWHLLPLLAVATTGLAGFLQQVRPQAPWSWREELLFSVTMYGLLAAVFVRLALNPSVFEYQARGLRIWNWYLYTYLICAAAMFTGAFFLSRARRWMPGGLRLAPGLLTGAGTVLLFLLLNIEIADFYSGGPTITFNFSATLAQDLTYTLGWAVFALGLLGAGLLLRSRPGRIAALLLLVATILKCFLHDLGRLGGLYRVGSFVGLAVCLALVALLLQRFVLSGAREGK
ncbi:MAG: rane protein-like protein, partial [Acidobacteria bacterium]|nr:rane protein-like protein [Acidobacteriota bacterium]